MSTPSRRHLKDLASLRRRRHRDRLGWHLVEGVRSVEAAAEAGAPLVELLVTDEARTDPRTVALAERAGVPVHTLPVRDLDRLADTSTTQGVVAVARIERAALPARGAVVALDGVQDPGNVGAILRTAAWFGADAVLAGPGTADPFGPKAVRSSMGGLWDLAVVSTDDLAADLARLKESGLRLAGADLAGAPARGWSPPRESVLVLGSEAHGLSEDVRALLDTKVRIGGRQGAGPRGTESLNVAVAAGVLLHRWLGG
ncbi:MAG: RNA methyltransferase [Bacteroidota bacterium]